MHLNNNSINNNHKSVRRNNQNGNLSRDEDDDFLPEEQEIQIQQQQQQQQQYSSTKLNLMNELLLPNFFDEEINNINNNQNQCDSAAFWESKKAMLNLEEIRKEKRKMSATDRVLLQNCMSEEQFRKQCLNLAPSMYVIVTYVEDKNHQNADLLSSTRNKRSTFSTSICSFKIQISPR